MSTEGITSVEGIIQVLRAQGGVASRRQLKAAGFSPRTVEEMVRRRELVTVRQDAVILGQALVDATPWARLALEARAVGLSLAPAVSPPAREASAVGDTAEAEVAGRDSVGGSAKDAPGPGYALSHESALMVVGLPYFAEDGLVHLVRTDGRRGRRDGTIWVHRPRDPDWVVDVEGIRVVKPVMAALQVAATHGAEAGVVALDGALHRAQQQDLDDTGSPDGPASAESRRQLVAALALGWGRDRSTVRLVAELGDGRSESAGESRSRWLLRVLGFGPTTPQFPVRDGPDLVGRADLKLDRWDVVVEFDGTGKYADPDSLVAEKDREDRIRRLGYEVVRLGGLTWPDRRSSGNGSWRRSPARRHAPPRRGERSAVPCPPDSCASLVDVPGG